MYGLDRKSAYGQLDKAAKGLMGRQVKTNDPKVKIREWINWMDRCLYHDGAGYIEASFNPSINPYLHRLAKQFTSYRLEVVSRVRSAYAIRLYELLIQFKDTGFRHLELDKFRDMLQVDSKYSRFVDLKRRVIEPSVKEINARTEILVEEWRPIKKTGRQVTALEFWFSENPQKQIPL
ncbi:Replication initiation protein [subsurface metagenome]